MMTTSNPIHPPAHHVEAVEQWKSDYQHAVAQELGVHPSILNESLNIGVMPWQFDDPGDVEYHDIQGRDAAVEGKAYAVEMREAFMRPGGPIQESAQLIFYRAYMVAAEQHGLLDEINYYEHEGRDPRLPDLDVSDYSFVPRQFASEDLLGDPADAAVKMFHADHADRLHEMKEEAGAKGKAKTGLTFGNPFKADWRPGSGSAGLSGESAAPAQPVHGPSPSPL